MNRSAVLSECETYRMQLIRCLERHEWTTSTQPGVVAWVLNNPSTADAEIDDPTVRKCWAFTRRWNYGQMMFVNTNPYRATDPARALVPPEAVLTANDSWLFYAMTQSPLVVAAWGDRANPMLAQRAVRVLHTLGPLHAMRVTKAGNPQHPLYLPADTVPELWKPKGLN